ncbi:target of rapamycin (TOR) kinase 1 [Trypanosoma cruzi]|nr:target of rapamycin (TOR) kinase 1 [Trypanosoma cruzi]
MAEAASCLDVKASFFKVSLPRETRHLFRCRVEDGTLVELTRLSMGYKASPEILQIVITSAIARATTVVHPSGPHLHWCVSTYGSVIYALQGRKATWHCGRPKCFVMRTVVTHPRGGPRIGRHAVHLSGGTI